MNNSFFITWPIFVIATFNLVGAVTSLMSNSSETTHKVGTVYEELSIERQNSIYKSEVIVAKPYIVTDILKEVEDRRVANHAKLLPENLSKPLVIYKSTN